MPSGGSVRRPMRLGGGRERVWAATDDRSAAGREPARSSQTSRARSPRSPRWACVSASGSSPATAMPKSVRNAPPSASSSTLDDFTELVISLRDRLGEKFPEPQQAVQSTENLFVEARVDFVATLPGEDEAPTLKAAPKVRFEGSVGGWTAGKFADEVLLLSYDFEQPESENVCLMFNTKEPCRVWLDGKFIFGRDGGVMAPSLHRAPEQQRVFKEISAGPHVLSVAVCKPASGDLEWVVGIGSGETKQWYPGALHRGM